MARGNTPNAPTAALIVTSAISCLFVGFNASRSYRRAVHLHHPDLDRRVAGPLLCGAIAALKLRLGGVT